MSQKRELSFVRLHGDLFIPNVGNLKSVLHAEHIQPSSLKIRLYLLENGDVECWAKAADGKDTEFIISSANCTVKVPKPESKVVPLKK